MQNDRGIIVILTNSIMHIVHTVSHAHTLYTIWLDKCNLVWCNSSKSYQILMISVCTCIICMYNNNTL